uniref:Uncharacterized protein n=1 Tax=Anguilla anguilla TaxID=7936 RepID=A0A0E9SYG8_ANGAN
MRSNTFRSIITGAGDFSVSDPPPFSYQAHQPGQAVFRQLPTHPLSWNRYGYVTIYL